MWQFLIPAAASLIGGMMRNESQEDQSAEQMAFQERMSGSAHQREVDDLKKAGLNPMLTGKYGGSSTPIGSAAQIEDSVTPAINSGMAAAQSRENLKLIAAQVEKTEAESMKARAEAAHVSQTTLAESEQYPIRTSLLNQEERGEGKFYEGQLSRERFGREYDVRRLYGVPKAEDLQRMFGTTMAIRDPVVLRYLLENPNIQSETRLRSIVARLHELDEPRARNVEESQSSWWMRNVSPYLHDAQRSIWSGAGLRQLTR